jgi:hypothetical protein
MELFFFNKTIRGFLLEIEMIPLIFNHKQKFIFQIY